MDRYKQNLRIDGDKVISYTTHVATIKGSKLLVHGYWSVTTAKHIGYVAREYGLEKVDATGESEVVDRPKIDKNIGTYAKIVRCDKHIGRLYEAEIVLVQSEGIQAKGYDSPIYQCYVKGKGTIDFYKCCCDFNDLEAYALTVKKNNNHEKMGKNKKVSNP